MTKHADSIDAILEHFRKHQTFVVTSHARPDGDAIGSTLGMMYLLEAMGKEVHMALADPIPAIYHSLPGIERIHSTLPESPVDVAIFLECDCLERTGFQASEWQRLAAGTVVNIDHHLSGRPFGDLNWIDPSACAVGAMIYDMVITAGIAISPGMATALYAAVLTDTGSFTYSSTVAATFGLAQHLLQRGAESNAVAQSVYFSNSPGKIRALGSALIKMEIEDSVAWSWISREEMERANARAEDCEGVVNHLISIAGIEAAVFLRELPSGEQFRLSLRSKGEVDVARVAESFGGGGHQNASGCTVSGPLESVIPRVLAELRTACTAAR
ncbi:MAG TPA: bifunctional oligoribonuclease/PAP phosphatase NrnA [Acidobacteriaceae bacterium]|jgi:phosphoesterase RecJ-like protein